MATKRCRLNPSSSVPTPITAATTVVTAVPIDADVFAAALWKCEGFVSNSTLRVASVVCKAARHGAF
jgi:hypothetical protein